MIRGDLEDVYQFFGILLFSYVPVVQVNAVFLYYLIQKKKKEKTQKASVSGFVESVRSTNGTRA